MGSKKDIRGVVSASRKESRRVSSNMSPVLEL